MNMTSVCAYTNTKKEMCIMWLKKERFFNWISLARGCKSVRSLTCKKNQSVPYEWSEILTLENYTETKTSTKQLRLKESKSFNLQAERS